MSRHPPTRRRREIPPSRSRAETPGSGAGSNQRSFRRARAEAPGPKTSSVLVPLGLCLKRSPGFSVSPSPESRRGRTSHPSSHSSRSHLACGGLKVPLYLCLTPNVLAQQASSSAANISRRSTDARCGGAGICSVLPQDHLSYAAGGDVIVRCRRSYQHISCISSPDPTADLLLANCCCVAFTWTRKEKVTSASMLWDPSPLPAAFHHRANLYMPGQT